MRVMVIIKGNEDSEAGKMPSERLLTEMTRFNEELVKAGVMLGGEGLTPTAQGKRVRFSGTRKTVVDGPFAEAKEVVAGFWIWKVESMEEAVEWVKRIPNPDPDAKDGEVEIRPVFELEDFGAELTPDTRERSERLRDELSKK